MIIQSTRVWLNGDFIPAQLEVDGKKIVAVHNYDAKKVDVEYGDKRLVPGFIDIHCHGAYGLIPMMLMKKVYAIGPRILLKKALQDF